MREILFKAKRKDNGEWVQGSLLQTTAVSLKSFIVESSCYTFDKWDWNECVQVDTDTLCQYTGWEDKNGNKIWENDLIECKEFSDGQLIKHFLSQVEWDDTGTGFTFKDGKLGWAFMDSLTVYECEVIGNVFDNPELLKGSEKE